MDTTDIPLAEADIRPGDILIHSAYWPDGKPVSTAGRVIAACGRGWADHVAVLDYEEQRGWMAIETVYKEGGRVVPVLDRVKKYPGVIHHFAVPDAVIIGRGDNAVQHVYDRSIAVATARSLAKNRYGTWQLVRDWAWHVPVVRLFLKMPSNGELKDWSPVCSCLGSLSVNAGFQWDLIPFLNDHYVEPSDLTRCRILECRGRLVP